MTAQLPTFRLTVAHQMEAYKQRIAEAIDRELKRQGKSESDLAHAIQAEKRTVERWTAGERTPQRRYRKPVADFLGLPMEVLYPDLEAEEKALREQLDRIEAKLDQVLGELKALRLAAKRPSRQPKSTPRQSRPGKAASGS